MIELLAPVGNRDALVAAVESGADAVYLAGQNFGARAYAANFDNEALKEAIDFAHKRGVSVDVTVNTLVDDGEFEDLAAYLCFLYNVGADAIIVQDLGVARLAREIVPALPLHASTQMTIHNLAGVRLLEALGFARVVLARETSLEDIRLICAHAKAEIEVFVHGALCISYSGQCLMSGMIGGRSGNRGRCAQPCRLPYTLVDAGGTDMLGGADAGEYLLSPKDMNALELLPELIDAGVTSFKIEGRMKKAEYVAVVTDTYRKRIDAYLASSAPSAAAQQEQKNLAQIFNRDFTTAYLKTRPGRKMMSDRRPNNRGMLVGRVLAYDARTKRVKIKLSEALATGDIIEFWVKVGGRVNVTVASMSVDGKAVECAAANQEVVLEIPALVRDHDRVFKVFDAKLMEKARAFFQAGAPIRRFDVDVRVSAQLGLPLKIEITDQEGFYGVAQTEFIVEKALKRPLTEESIRKQIERLGTTVFALRSLECRILGDVMAPVSEINEARRKAVDMLEAARLAKYERPALSGATHVSHPKRAQANRRAARTNPLLCASVDTVEKVKVALREGADVILFGGDCFGRQEITAMAYRTAYEMVKHAGKKILYNTPRLLKEWQVAAFQKLFAELATCAPDAISIHNLGTIALLRDHSDAPLHADMSLNVYNAASLVFLASLGVQSATLSPELNFMQIERLAGSVALPLECIVQGHLELMVSEYCAMGSFLGGLEKGKCERPCERKQYFLLDRKGEKFPLVTDSDCRMHVLNGKQLSMAPHVSRFEAAGISRIRMEGKYATVDALAKWTKLYRELIDLGAAHPLLTEKRGAAAGQEEITRGHYFRGVL